MASPRLRPSVLALSAGAFAAIFLAAPASAGTLAKVDGVEITDEDAKVAAEDLAAVLPPQLQQPGPARDAYVLDYLIDARLVGRQAEKEKFGEAHGKVAKLLEGTTLGEHLARAPAALGPPRHRVPARRRRHRPAPHCHPRPGGAGGRLAAPRRAA